MDIRSEIRGVTKIESDERTLLRLMNICSHKGIKIWGDPHGEESCLRIYSDEDESVREIVKNCMLDVTMTDQESFRNKIKSNKRRLSVLIGVILFGIYIYIESLFIWRIDVNGCGNYTEDEVINVIEQYYPCFGKRKSKIDSEELEEILADHLSDVCWASCSIRGTKLTVRISESVDVFTDNTPDNPCNLISSMDCTVYSIVTSMGTPVVVAGDEVKKGDLLITGVVNICNDDSEIVDTRYVPAQGQIIGQCSIPYHDEISSRHYDKKVISTVTNSVSIQAGRKIVSLYDKSDKKKTSCQNIDTEQNEYWLHVGDFYLPFAIHVSRSHICDVDGAEYSADELKDLAEQHIVTYIGKLQEKGVQIVQKNVIITNGSDKVTADGNIIVRLPVGIPEIIRQIGTDDIESGL